MDCGTPFCTGVQAKLYVVGSVTYELCRGCAQRLGVYTDEFKSAARSSGWGSAFDLAAVLLSGALQKFTRAHRKAQEPRTEAPGRNATSVDPHTDTDALRAGVGR